MGTTIALIVAGLAGLAIIFVTVSNNNKKRQKEAEERRRQTTVAMSASKPVTATSSTAASGQKRFTRAAKRRTTNSKGQQVKDGCYFDEDDNMYDMAGDLIEAHLMMSFLVGSQPEQQPFTAPAAVEVVHTAPPPEPTPVSAPEPEYTRDTYQSPASEPASYDGGDDCCGGSDDCGGGDD